MLNFRGPGTVCATEVADKEVFPLHVTDGVHTAIFDVSREKMIANAKLICDASGIPEVWLNDLDNPGHVTVVKRNESKDSQNY